MVGSVSSDVVDRYVDAIHAELGFKDETMIDPVVVARELGFDVFRSAFSDSNISGMVINSSSVKAIYVNKADIIQRQRFTVAHEIGHIVLHHKTSEMDYREVDFRSSKSGFSLKEFEANSFAAALLMPKEKSKNIWHKLQDVDDFANAFQVSKKAAAIRLMNLGLLS